MSRQAVIVGWAHTPFGRLDVPDLESLIATVAQGALTHAEVQADEIDAVTVGVYGNGLTPQAFEGGLASLHVPGLRFAAASHLENACASGSAALYAAMDFIESGRGRFALAIGAEKMTAASQQKLNEVLATGCYRKEEENPQAMAGTFGELAQMYFDRYGNRSAELAMIAAKNHRNGVSNPLAHVRKDLGFEFCNTPSDSNPMMAGPLRRTDCSMVSDGAAAIVLADHETAASMARAVRFRSRQQVNDFLPISKRDPVAFEGARRAWSRALGQASLGLDDLSFVETHDCFTIAEMIEYEAMGLAQVGQGWRIPHEGIALKTGRLPINPSGGLKAKGHPLGATGVSMHVMAAMQLMGEAGDMQIPGAKLAGVFNMGGVAVANYVSILERTK